MEMLEFLRTRRTIRRFEPRPVPAGLLAEAVDAARVASCGTNRQTVKYIIVQPPETVAKTPRLGHWAAALPPEQGRPRPGQQGAVGGHAGTEVLPGADVQDLSQLRVEKGLPHHVEVHIPGMAPQGPGRQAEALRGHPPRGTPGAGAEAAAQVTEIGDLHIGPLEHAPLPLSPGLAAIPLPRASHRGLWGYCTTDPQNFKCFAGISCP